jgi:hypothetical protein
MWRDRVGPTLVARFCRRLSNTAVNCRGSGTESLSATFVFWRYTFLLLDIYLWRNWIRWRAYKLLGIIAARYVSRRFAVPWVSYACEHVCLEVQELFEGLGPWRRLYCLQEKDHGQRVDWGFHEGRNQDAVGATTKIPEPCRTGYSVELTESHRLCV